ncbi:MAG: adenylate/guanylate cyclase domain-containing protein [Actinomycetota bacterium]
MPEQASSAMLRPYLPQLLIRWLADEPDRIAREIDGSVVFVDISGFTKMSERLAKKGKVGAEEVTDVLGSVFARLLALAYAEGGGLLKFGGDALLLFFSGDQHPLRAVRAADGMRRKLREIGSIESSAGQIRLRMSVGVHSGRFNFFLVGGSHREFMIAGPAASETVLMEGTASAGEVMVSPSTARFLPETSIGAWKETGFLLRRGPGGIASDPVIPQTDLDGVDLSQGIPLAIRDYLQSGAVEPEHRKVAIAFLHYDGTDALVAEGGPMSAALALDELIRDVQGAADRNEVTFLGTDVDRDGGKIILVAGAPMAAGDDGERLLLTLREVADKSRRLHVRLGLNLGPVFAGNIGPSYRRTYTIMGDAVNLAARLMAKAQPGQIIATSGVLEASTVSFQTEPLPPFMVKGKAAPITAFAVGQVSRVRRERLREDLPLIGRERELRELDDGLALARTGEGRIVEIVGPPGIGKTRLLRELQARSDGFVRLDAACELYGATVPYLLFHDLLREAIGLPDDADDAVTLEHLRGTVVERAPVLEPWLPLIATVAGAELPATPEVQQLDESFRKDQLERAVGSFLAAVLTEPAVITIEDAHWMDELSRDLLTRLVSEQLADAPWLICLTRRDEATGFVAPEDDAVHTIMAQPLDEADTLRMIRVATEDDPFLPRENEMLAERSAGNPLFLEELVHVARARGVDSLPDSVEAVVTAQIDRLSPAARSLLRTVSVLGVAFEQDLVEQLLEPDGAVPTAAEWKALADFLEAPAPGEWRFRHALMRDAAFEGLPYRRRRDLHGRAAELIESGAPDAADAAELLSLHYFNAQRFPDAWRYSLISGDRARDHFANGQAAEFYERALESARKLSDIEERQLAQVRESLGDVLVRMGEFVRAREAFRGGRKLLRDDPIAEARILLKQAKIPERLGRYSDALRLLARGRNTLAGMDGVDPSRQRAKLAVFYASIKVAQGRGRDAITWCERAIDEPGASQDLETLAHAYAILDWALVLEGRAEGYANSRRALEIYTEKNDPAGQAVVLNNLGAFEYFDGHWDDAVALYERGRDARERTGDPVNAAYGTCNVGEILSDQGRLEEADPLLRDAMRVWRAAGDRAGVAFAESLLGRLASRAGRADEAMERLIRAHEVFVQVGSQTDVMDAEGRIAECLVFCGLAEAALERVGTALVKAEAQEGVSGQTPLLQRVRGWALMQLGRTEDARIALDVSLAVGRAREAPYEVALTLRAIGQLDRLEGRTVDDEYALEARRIMTELGVTSVPEVPDTAIPAELTLLPDATVIPPVAAVLDIPGAGSDLLRS